MKESRDYLELAYYSVQAFCNDGTLDEDELDKLLEIALRDGKVDDEETRVLSNIIRRLTEHELTDAIKKKIKDVEKKYNVKIFSS